MVIGGVGEPITLRLEHEARRLDFLPQRHGIDSVQRFGIAQAAGPMKASCRSW
jgi:hypothetical protein